MTYTLQLTRISKTILIAMLVGLLLNLTIMPAMAAELTEKSDLMNRLKISTLSNHEIKFSTSTGVTAGQTITVTFPSDFSIDASLDNTDVDLAESNQASCTGGTFTEKTLGAAPSGATWGAVRTSGTVFTFTSGTDTITASRCVRIKMGTNATSGATGDKQVTNATTSGSKIISIGGTMADSGSMAVGLVDDDQVALQTTVDPSITFDIDTPAAGAACGSETATPYSVDFGTVTTTDTRVSGSTDSVPAICLDTTSNGTDGIAVTVTSSNAALKSLSVAADTIASSSAPLADGAEVYGICVVTAGTGLTKASPFNSTCADNSETNSVGEVTTSAQNILTATGPVASGVSRIAAGVSIASDTEAHKDYKDTLTFIATATF